MLRSKLAIIAVALLTPCGVARAALPCSDVQKPPAGTVVFDHLNGSILTPVPTVLELRDGEIFAIEFQNTVPSLFDYEIKSIETDKERTASFKSDANSAEVEKEQLTCAALSWKHSDLFSLYQVTVTLRQGESNPEIDGTEETEETDALRGLAAADRNQIAVELKSESADPEDLAERYSRGDLMEALEDLSIPVPEKLKPIYLYSYTFPVWVKTVAWKLSFTSGAAFSDLRNDKFFVETDGQGTTDASDDEKFVRRDRGGRGASRPDMVAFVNLLSPDAGLWREIKLGGRAGLAFGLGLSGDGDPRYFFGPSWTIGRKDHFVLIAGWSGGNVDRLPSGQRLDASPISDNVLSSLDSSFEHGVFAGLTFSFNPRTQEDFTKALNGKAGRTDTGQEEDEDTSDDDADEDDENGDDSSDG